MNFNYKVYQDLYNRQVYIGNTLNSNFYEKRIIKSCFDSISNFYLLKNKFHTGMNFHFSEDDNYLALDNAVWRIKDNFNFDKSCKIMKISDYDSARGMAFNKDSSKFFVSKCSLNREDIITVFDLSKSKNALHLKMDFKVGDISSSPSSPNIFAFNCLNGNIYLRDLRKSTSILIDNDIPELRNLQFNPIKDHLILVTSKSVDGVFVLDLRNNQHVMNYNVLYNHELNIFSGCYNKKGDQVLLNRTNANPLLYFSDNPYPVYEFDEFGFFYSYKTHSRLEPIRISKNSCFVGADDEFVAVSSHNANVYIWEIPQEKLIDKYSDYLFRINSAKFILKHSSRVFHIEYNHKWSVLACSESSEQFKLWSPFELVLNYSHKKKYCSRENYYGASYHNPMYKAHQRLNFFISCCFTDINRKGLFNENFMINFQTFNDINIDDFYNELKKDLNIIYIKSFILIYDKTLKYKNSKLLKKIKEITEDDFDFTLFFKDDYFLSIFIEIFKLYLSKIFLNKSIKYLSNENLKIKLLVKEILILKLEIPGWKKKLNSLNKIKIVLNLMIIDLQFILLKDENYFDPFSLLKYLFKSFYDYSDRSLNEFKFVHNFNFLGMIEPKIEQKFLLRNQKTENYKLKESLYLNIYEEDLNDNLLNLKKKLKIKRQKKNKLNRNLALKMGLDFFFSKKFIKSCQ